MKWGESGSGIVQEGMELQQREIQDAFLKARERTPREGDLFVFEEQVLKFRTSGPIRKFEVVCGLKEDPKPGEELIALGLTEGIVIEAGLSRLIPILLEAHLNASKKQAEDFFGVLERALAEAGWKSPTTLPSGPGTLEAVSADDVDYFDVEDLGDVARQLSDMTPRVTFHGTHQPSKKSTLYSLHTESFLRFGLSPNIEPK